MMKKIQVAAAVALALSSVSVAQQAVQWKVSEGGNGHWYAAIRPANMPSTFAGHDAFVQSIGASMTTLKTPQELAFATGTLSGQSGESNGAFFGLRRQADGSWMWVDGTSPAFTAWGGSNCGSGPYPNNQGISGEMVGHLYRRECGWIWDDTPPAWQGLFPNLTLLVEWDSDCNNDGIVDYGQCRDGSLPDYNGNNIPDCCESGTACVVGNYPVQWRVEDGGNGHWYQVRPKVGVWEACRTDAHASGGNLGSLSTQQENDFVEAIIPALRGARKSVFLGGRQSARSSSSSEWYWIDGSTWSYTDWERNQPDGGEGYLAIYSLGASVVWGDYPSDDSDICCFLVEWSADCNNDGIADYGQILTGQLADSNNNGAPDVCEAVTCRDADFFPDRNVNGADLGLLLSQWGEANQYTVTDLNRDGTVDGADLGIVLSFWGPCAY